MFGRKAAATLEAPAPVVDSREVAYAHSWGFQYSEWLALTAEQRADYRDRVAYAPNFNTAGS
jgi:hypothetical protein